VSALLTVGVILVGYAAVSGALDRRGVTSAMLFVAAGFAVGPSGLGFVDIPATGTVAETVTELALVFLLFSDAARIDLRSLRRHLDWPGRLLLVSLPLSMAVGFGAALLVLPSLAVASAFLLATMLCATDAALGQRVVEDEAVPSRVRQALDVESGLNDGLAVPFFLVALDISLNTLDGGVPSAVVNEIAAQLGWGVVAGVGAGAAGGLLFHLSDDRGWLHPRWQQVFTLAVTFCAFAAADELGGSVFIAAFLGGIAFRRAARKNGSGTTYLTEQVGDVLAAVMWIGFGAIAISLALPIVTWRIALYAVISLTVTRMLAVALALARTGARWQTMAFMGWFGPRGLASVVFALLALERQVPEARTLLATVVVTVTLSVFLHGLTAMPLVSAYHRWCVSRDVSRPTAEARPTPLPRQRHRIGETGSELASLATEATDGAGEGRG